MSDFETTINGCPVLIRASVTGKYYPATRHDPEEFPEVEVIGIEYEGKDLPAHFFTLLNEEIIRIECEISCGDLEAI